MKALNLIGQKFGKLTVLAQAPNQGKLTAWECKCECGEKCIATTKRLRNGTKKSCGCLGRVHNDIIIGEKINLLTPLYKIKKGRYIYWVCECDCGNITEVADGNLKAGAVKSCGCLRRAPSSHRLDLSGQKFGYLTAIEIDENKSEDNRLYWKCICDCGNITSILRENLTAPSRFPSCGCQTASRGEKKIQELLEKHSIPFTKEKVFPSCKNPKTGKELRFDFYVDNSYLIEYDGEQHFKESKNSWEPLEEVQYRDELKNQWCKENNIPLIRIPYTDYTTLTIEDLLLSAEVK